MAYPISASSVSVSSLSPAVENQSDLTQSFERLGIGPQAQKYLLERFNDKKDVLSSLLNHLDNGVINATDDPNLDSYATVPSERLETILTSIAKYDCGKEQLTQLENDLRTENIKLKFVQPQGEIEGQDAYALLSTKSLSRNSTIYVSIQPERPNPNPKGRWICEYKYSNNTISRSKLDETSNFTGELSFEGYKCGHELSHAIAFVRFYKSQNPRPSGEEVYNNWNVKHNTWKFLPSENRDKIWDVFSEPEEYRNLLGLGVSKTFEDDDRIIGEFDYLNELMHCQKGSNPDVIYIRMPYDTDSLDNTIALDVCKNKYHQINPSKPINSTEKPINLTENCILV